MSQNNQNNSMGQDGFIFFMGVVECVSDPEKLGRAKVRVIGDHSQSKEDIPTEDLPWAMPMMPVTTASMNGIGQAPIGLVQGSWVIGFYRDAMDKQQPIIMGSIGGLPIMPALGEVGFNDPIECFPQETKLGEPDTNRHARGIEGKHAMEPIPVTVRRESIMVGMATATSQWDEPMTPYAPIYPYNYAWEGPYNPTCDGCEWGHIEEWDSTPGAERYFRQHKTSQNFLEIHPDGKEVRKIYGDGFEIDLGSKHLYVEGDYRVTVMGNKDEHIKGDYWQHVEGNYIRVVEGDKVSTTVGIDSSTMHDETVRRSKGNIFDVTEMNHVRMANDNINDSSGSKITSITVDQHTIGTGSYSPVVIVPIPPEVVTGNSMPGVALSCMAPNEAKSSISSIIVPVVPDYDVVSTSVADTQIQIIPDVIYVDSVDTHILSTNYVKEDTHFNANVFVLDDVEIMGDVKIEGDIDNLGSIYSGGSIHAAVNVNAGAVISTPTLNALLPMAIDPVVEHPYLVPTAGTSPTAPSAPAPPDPFVIPEKGEIDKTVVIPEEVYAPNDKAAGPVVPGPLFDCGF